MSHKINLVDDPCTYWRLGISMPDNLATTAIYTAKAHNEAQKLLNDLISANPLKSVPDVPSEKEGPGYETLASTV